MENTDKDTQANTEADSQIKRSMGRGRIWIPIGLVCVGAGLLVRQMGVGVPDWLFNWPMLLIFIGIINGLAHAFRGPGWIIMILVGTFFLVDQIIPGIDIHRYIWPIVIITVGLVMLIRPKKPNWMDHDWHHQWKDRDLRRWQRRRARRGYPGNITENPSGPNANASSSGSSSGMGYSSKSFSSEDYIDATTIFGGIHKNILSKNFKGGDITIFMGGAELNLTQADIQGTAELDITQIMGGTKIIVPPHWEIRSQLTSVLGSIEDKRQNIGITDPNKILIINGSSVLGGIEIKSY
jgi:predicted membrane protein